MSEQMSEHTDLPWKSHGDYIVPADSIHDGYGSHQSGMYIGRVAEVYDSVLGKAKRAKANMGFIIRACNAHNDLLAALHLIARSSEFNGGTWLAEVQQIAREAIAKAEKF